MLNQKEILSTIEMIDQQHLDIRTITMGISLLSCSHPSTEECCRRIYDKICRHAENGQSPDGINPRSKVSTLWSFMPGNSVTLPRLLPKPNLQVSPLSRAQTKG